jgi:CHAT domain
LSDTIVNFFGQGASARLVPAGEYWQGLLRFSASHPEVTAALAEFHRSPGTVADLVTLSRRYADALPDDDPRRPAALMKAAIGLRQLFLETDDPDVPYDGHSGHFRALFEAVAYGRRAVGDDPEHDRQQVPVLDDFSRILATAYDRVAERPLLLDMVAVNRRAVAATRDGSAEHAAALSRLAYSLHRLYDHSRDSDALAEAIAATHRAIGETATGDPQFVTRLDDMVFHLTAYYEVTADVGKLREAVEFRRRAVEAAADTDRLHYQLNRLFGELQRLFGKTNDTSALAEQVAVGQRALKESPPGSAERSVVSSGLAGALLELSRRTNDSDKLREAIDIRRRVAGAASTGQLPGELISLVSDLVQLFQRTEDVSALHEAVATARHAVSVSNATEEHTRALAALGVVLALIAEHTGDADALNEAIDIAGRVAATFPEGHPARSLPPPPREAAELVPRVRQLYQECVHRDLAVKAAATFAMASGALPSPQHTMYAQGANLGGIVLATFAELSSDPAMTATARKHFARAAESPIAPVSARIEAAARSASLDMTAGHYNGAVAAVQQAAELLPMFATRLLSRSDREGQLARIAGIGSLGAAAAIAAGRPVQAVEFLEQCRGLLLAEAMDSRRELSGLRARAPQLAEEFNRLRELLQSLETSRGPRHAEHRRDAATQWEELLDRIRMVPGQANFLRPPIIEDLQQHAAGGPIVMITLSRWRCDALIITPDPARPVRHVPLPDLSYEETVGRVAAFKTAMTTATGEDSLSRRAEAQRDIHATLEWLWDTTAEPILSSLGYADSPGHGPGAEAPWPRLWWCPTGPMAYLPLHAAGHHREDLAPGAAQPRTVLDRVVSSYIPSVRSLAYARRPGDTGASVDQPALIVAVPDAPGAPPLPGAPAEAEQVRAFLATADVLSGTEATYSAVQAALPAHGIVHFACHGLVATMPSASTLVLHDHDTDPLDVATISRLELTVAELAYLSACTTSQTSPRMADESIHITSAFQLAGYRHVVGTLWPVSDYAAARLARYFYGSIAAGTGQPRTQHAAYALHQATRRLRSEGPNVPSSWATPVHAGA